MTTNLVEAALVAFALVAGFCIGWPLGYLNSAHDRLKRLDPTREIERRPVTCRDNAVIFTFLAGAFVVFAFAVTWLFVAGVPLDSFAAGLLYAALIGIFVGGMVGANSERINAPFKSIAPPRRPDS